MPNEQRAWPDPIGLEELHCLNSWEEGTVGFQVEDELLRELNDLCIKHGYGAIPQLTYQLRQLWYHASERQHFEKMRQERLARIKEYRNAVDTVDKDSGGG